MNTQVEHRSRSARSALVAREPIDDARTVRSGNPSSMKQPVTRDTSTLVDLVNAAKAGDQDSWNQLVDRFLPLVTGVISRYRLPAADADDVNQSVWLRLVEHLDDLREPLALPGWLATIARNESVRLIRLRSHDTPVDPQSTTMTGAVDVPDLDENLVREERASALREAMLELPAQRRELLMLLMADPPVSYEQISAIMGIAIGSIGPTRARALEQLRNVRSVRALAADMEPGASY